MNLRKNLNGSLVKNPNGSLSIQCCCGGGGEDWNGMVIRVVGAGTGVFNGLYDRRTHGSGYYEWVKRSGPASGTLITKTMSNTWTLGADDYTHPDPYGDGSLPPKTGWQVGIASAPAPTIEYVNG